MLFENFNQVGKGISKDAPQKTGLRLFIDILNREFWTLIGVNILFIIYCIPIVTIGASYSALNSIIIKMLRDKPVDLIHDFKLAFKKNFSQGTISIIITTIITAIMILAFNFYYITNTALSYLILVICFIFFMINNYVAPMIVSVDLKLSYIYKNSLNLMFICFPYSLASGILQGIIFAICFILFPETILYLLVIGFSFSCFINCFFAYKGIKTYAESSNILD